MLARGEYRKHTYINAHCHLFIRFVQLLVFINGLIVARGITIGTPFIHPFFAPWTPSPGLHQVGCVLYAFSFVLNIAIVQQIFTNSMLAHV